MKKITAIIFLLSMIGVKSQVAIGKNNVSNASVSLEFGNTEPKGMILPYVTDKSAITENGTVIYNATNHKVEYLKDTNTWFDLSVDTAGVADLSIQGSDKTEQAEAKATIGVASTTPGILVLSDADKAMILPKVASPHLNIINPSPGMMVYDTTKRQLAVYNGTNWSFWKP